MKKTTTSFLFLIACLVALVGCPTGPSEIDGLTSDAAPQRKVGAFSPTIGAAGTVQTSNGSGGLSGATNVFAGTSFVSVGASPAASGNVRLPATSAVTFLSSGSANTNLISTDGADNISVGQATVVGSVNLTASSLFVHANSTFFQDQASSVNLLKIDTTAIQPVLPIIGYAAGNSPYGVHGGVAVSVTSSPQALTSAQYNLDWIKVSTTTGANFTVTLPAPASLAVGYYKTLFNNSAFTMTVSTTSGSKTIATNLAQRIWFDSSGTFGASPTFTP